MRIGLAMSGGIALVLYEAGVAHELLRFVRAWAGASAPSSAAGASAAADTAARAGGASTAYAQAFDAAPIEPVLDILTGASAGGINSVLLGSCLATGIDFAATTSPGRTSFHDAWIEDADVQVLRYGRGAPQSLLDPAPIIATIRATMADALACCRGNPTPGAPDLDVRLCLTHLRGHCVATEDTLAHTIEEPTKNSMAWFGVDDFANEERLDLILDGARATSAFPGAFPPVEIGGRYYVDGGLWDNQPIDAAVRAVVDKPAMLRTHRCIMFVDPDPLAKQPPVSAAEPEPTLAQTLAGLPLMGLKGTIWPAVTDILSQDQRASILERILGNATLKKGLEAAGAIELNDSRAQLGVLRDRSGAATMAPLLPTALNQVRINKLLLDDDPALVQRWNRALESCGLCAGDPGASRSMLWCSLTLAALQGVDAIGELDLLRTWLRRSIRDQNAELARTDTQSPAAPSAPPPDSMAVAPGAEGAELLDVRAPAEPEAREAVRSGAALKAVRYAYIAQINSQLYDHTGSRVPEPAPSSVARHLHARAPLATSILRMPDDETTSTRSVDDQADAQAGGDLIGNYLRDFDRPTSRFRPATMLMLDRVETALADRARAPEDARSDVEAAAAAWIAAIHSAAPRTTTSASALVGQRPTAPGRWGTPARAIGLYYRHVGAEQSSGAGAAAPVFSAQALQKAASALDTSLGAVGKQPAGAPPAEDAPWTVVEYLFGAISDLGSGAGIDLIRVSPNDTDNLNLIPCGSLGGQTAAERKLAGEGLGHFTGFFERRWRRNDYVWGRLDAAEILLRTLQTYGNRELRSFSEKQYRDCLEAVQTEILHEEAELAQTTVAAPDPMPDPSQVGGIHRGSGPADSVADPVVAARQRANAKIIGFGNETILDANEPGFSDDRRYLVDTAIALARGSFDKPPAALDSFSRMARVASYPLGIIASSYVGPGKPTARRVARLAALVAVLMVFSLLVGAGVANTLWWIAYGAAGALLFMTLGCVLGWRWGFAVITAFFVGVFAAASVLRWEAGAPYATAVVAAGAAGAVLASGAGLYSMLRGRTRSA